MASNEKVDILRSFLGSLPEALASRLARVVEVDRMNNGTGLPHDLILDSLRPVLRKAEPEQRTSTPIRAFCRPFEDLLVNDAPRDKRKGQITRSSITPVWNWLAQVLIPDALNAYSLAVKMAVLAGRADEMREKTDEFWQTSARAIREKLASEPGRKAARAALGGDTGIADALEMATMLCAAKEVCELQDRLPKTIPSLTEDLIQIFRDVYDRVMQSAPEAGGYLPLVVMKRLEHPWEALRLPLNISRNSQETLIAATDMGLVGEVLFGLLEHHAAVIRAARPNQFNADTIISHLEGFTGLSNGMVKEVELRRDGNWGQRLIKDRAAVADVMQGFMERAAKEISAALPTQKSGSYAGGPRVPDFSKPSDPEKTDRALSYARLIAGCRKLASAASFAAALKNADEEVGVALESYNDNLVREMRSVGEDVRLNAEQFFAIAIELTATLFSFDEGEFLRRRGRAATAAAA